MRTAHIPPYFGALNIFSNVSMAVSQWADCPWRSTPSRILLKPSSRIPTSTSGVSEAHLQGGGSDEVRLHGGTTFNAGFVDATGSCRGNCSGALADDAQ